VFRRPGIILASLSVAILESAQRRRELVFRCGLSSLFRLNPASLNIGSSNVDRRADLARKRSVNTPGRFAFRQVIVKSIVRLQRDKSADCPQIQHAAILRSHGC
jgi:hypothetical protein